jgi:signal transduction histidine kinase
MSLSYVTHSKRGVLRLITLLVFLQWAFTLPAQPEVPGYETYRIGIQNGLNNQNVTCVVQDQHYALWFGTDNGLYRYDGYRTVRIDTIYVKHPFHLDAYVTHLAIDVQPNGIIFVCTKFGAKIIDPSTGRYVSPSDLGFSDSLFKSFSSIAHIKEDVFLGLSGRTMYKIQKIKAGKYTCQPWYNIPDSASPLKIVVDPDNPDATWLLLEKERTLLHAGPQGMERYNLPESERSLPGGIIGMLHIISTPKGIFGWDVARNIYKFDRRSRQFIDVTPSVQLSDLIPNLIAVDVMMKKKQSLHCFLKLNADQLVLGTSLGLFIVRKKISGFHTFNAIHEEEVRGIYTDSTGKWAIGTYYGFYTGKFGEQKVKKHPQFKIVWDFLPLNNHRCLIGLERMNGLALWDPLTDKIIDSNLVSRMQKPIEGNSVLCLERDALGITWAGAYKSLLWSPPDSPFVFRLYKDPVTGQPLKHDFIRAILAARDSSLWIGTVGGLYCMRYGPTMKQYQLKTAVTYTGKVPISDLYEDRYGHIWIGSKGKGLGRLDKANGQIQWFNIDAGLCDSMVCRIESSRHDSILWISTHNGLSRLDVNTGIIHNFYEENGFPGNEFNSAASTRYKDGTLFFGGVNGLVYFHPDSILVSDYRYETSVLYVHLYKRSVDSLIALVRPTKMLNIEPYPELLEFVLGTNEFIQPEKMRYRYRLLGLSDKWNYTTGENKIKYVHLSPGDYEFQAQAIPFEGHFGAVFTLVVFVATPYNETWWFKAFIISIIILLAYAAYRYQLRQIRKEQLIRQQIGDDLHDDIGNKLNIIGIIAQKISVFLQKNNAPLPDDNSLNNLLELSRETQLTLITMIWAVDPSKDKLSNLIARMQDFADDFIRPLLPQFSFTAPQIIPNHDLSLRVRHHLILIYQELLVNMIKHTHSNGISVNLYLNGATIALIITNMHQPELHQPKGFISANRGQITLNRRIKEINGTIEYLEEAAGVQKITLMVPKIFNKS